MCCVVRMCADGVCEAVCELCALCAQAGAGAGAGVRPRHACAELQHAIASAPL
jgi:hypothetical protein